MKSKNNMYKPFFSDQQFEQNIEGQQDWAQSFLKVYTDLYGEEGDLVSLDFFFEAASWEKAQALIKDLQILGYTCNPTSQEAPYYISGSTTQMLLTHDNFLKWLSHMNEMGFVNDCLFDGWGILNEGGHGLFGD